VFIVFGSQRGFKGGITLFQGSFSEDVNQLASFAVEGITFGIGYSRLLMMFFH